MNKVLITFLVIFAALIYSSCGKIDYCRGDPLDKCYITLEAHTICGCNGKTYGNPSTAACDGITDYTEGECE